MEAPSLSAGADEGSGEELPEAREATEEPEAKKNPSRKNKAAGRSQFFTFTLNLGKVESVALERVAKHAAVIEAGFFAKKLSFYSGGHEVAPTTGEHHVQGYLEVAKGLQWTYDTFKKFLSKTNTWKGMSLWVNKSKGSALENVKYTHKPENVGRWELTKGEFRNYGQGKSAAMAKVKTMLDSGANMKKVYSEEFEASAQHYRFFKEYRLVMTKPRSWAMEVFYIHGPSGSGKSSIIERFWPLGDDTYWLTVPKAGQNVWWDGYDGQSTVVIDDWKPGYFGPGHVLFMQRLVDRYPFKVPVHGGLVEFTSKVIVFTSNTPPDRMDSEEFSGYPWNASNPLFHRVYLREPRWHIVQIGLYSTQPNPTYLSSTSARAVQSALADLEERKSRVSAAMRLSAIDYILSVTDPGAFEEELAETETRTSGSCEVEAMRSSPPTDRAPVCTGDVLCSCLNCGLKF